MKMYIAKIISYYEDKFVTDYLIIAGENSGEVLKEIYDYYEDYIATVQIKLINDYRPLIRLPNKKIYKTIEKRGEI